MQSESANTKYSSCNAPLNWYAIEEEVKEKKLKFLFCFMIGKLYFLLTLKTLCNYNWTQLTSVQREYEQKTEVNKQLNFVEHQKNKKVWIWD